MVLNQVGWVKNRESVYRARQRDSEQDVDQPHAFLGGTKLSPGGTKIGWGKRVDEKSYSFDV